MLRAKIRSPPIFEPDTHGLAGYAGCCWQVKKVDIADPVCNPETIKQPT
jgi:hypothetical protein